MTPQLTGRCAKCGGYLYRDDKEIKCLQCGTRWISHQERHEFNELHRKLIVEDYQKGGAPGVEKRWGIPSGSIGKLLDRWEIERVKAPTRAAARKKPAATPEPGADESAGAEAPPVPKSNGMPPMPAFSSDWPEEVQLRWLDTYRELILNAK